MTNGPVRILINAAYPTRSNEIVNAPDWVTSENYDVEAIATPTATYDDIAQMMRTMLAERFKLVAHNDNRQRPVYTLLLARDDGKLGPNIRPSTADCTNPEDSPSQPPASVGALAACTARFTRGSMEASGFSMEALASNLAGPAGRVVLDRTGLTGDYDFTLRYSPELASRDGTASGEPSLFTALREQLSLKLQDSVTVLPVVVIDHIERPTPD